MMLYGREVNQLLEYFTPAPARFGFLHHYTLPIQAQLKESDLLI